MMRASDVTAAQTAIDTDLVAAAGRIAAALGGPRVRALHLPPAHLRTGKEAEFCALELDDGAIGMSYLWLAGIEDAVRDADGLRRLPGSPAAALAGGLATTAPGARALGVAALNALSQSLYARAGWRPADAPGAVAGIDARAGTHVGMVGYFPPLVPMLTATGARVTVLELRTDLAGAHDGWRVVNAPAALADCDQVLCTSTVLLNGTLASILHATPHARRFSLIGPGAGCVPDTLFAHGVTALAGTCVSDRAGFLAALADGRRWGPFARKTLIERDGYPGLEALLARL